MEMIVDYDSRTQNEIAIGGYEISKINNWHGKGNHIY
jgi:hypothetical protein